MMFGPIMVSWVVAGLTVRTDYQDLVTILGHLATTVVTILNMLVLVRNHREDAGYRDGYKQARKLQYFSIFPSKLGESEWSQYPESQREGDKFGWRRQSGGQTGWSKVFLATDQSSGLHRIAI